jgi:hypothetical protein
VFFNSISGDISLEEEISPSPGVDSIDYIRIVEVLRQNQDSNLREFIFNLPCNLHAVQFAVPEFG